MVSGSIRMGPLSICKFKLERSLSRKFKFYLDFGGVRPAGISSDELLLELHLKGTT